MSDVCITLRYQCSQCKEYFNVDAISVLPDTILEQPPIVVFNMFKREEVHACYGHVPTGRQRFFGLGKLVGWTYRFTNGDY